MRIAMRLPLMLIIGPAAGACLAAAALPEPLTSGRALWEVSKAADGSGAHRICVPEPAMLAQWEHRNSQCERTVVRASGDKAVIEYSCSGGGFGRSDVRLVTPRTLRIDTQGIADSYPFAYVLHARKIGDCPSH